MQIKRLKIEFGDITIDYDKCYGYYKKFGWSLAIKGHYILQFGTLPDLIHFLVNKDKYVANFD